jgi:putative transposase
MEQVAAELKFRLVFSTKGMPRGRGKIERFFGTVNELLLSCLPGYAPKGHVPKEPLLTLSALNEHFHTWITNDYLKREHSEIAMAPLDRWEMAGFLPHMPESLAQLDLLLMTVAKARTVHQDGIRFQNLRYFDLTLAAFVGEPVQIRYDPQDLAEIRVYYRDKFLCRAICAELAGHSVTLKDVIQARNRRRNDLRGQLKGRKSIVDQYLAVHHPDSGAMPIGSEEPAAQPADQQSANHGVKRYVNE